MISLFLILMLGTTNGHAETALDCETAGVEVLNLVNPVRSVYKDPVSVQWRLVGNSLQAQFDVNIPVQSQKLQFGPKNYPFQFDVVEIFLAVNNPEETHYSYYEFELTPNNQIFNVRIESRDGTKRFFNYPTIEGLQVRASRSAKNWSGQFTIPLDKLGWTGDPKFLRGNFYAILGRKQNKSYWSAFLPQQKRVNFHLTEFFQPLCLIKK